MWLYRVLFNVKARLLNQKTEEEHHCHSPAPWVEDDAAQRAQIIRNRLDDLDRRLEPLKSR